MKFLQNHQDVAILTLAVLFVAALAATLWWEVEVLLDDFTTALSNRGTENVMIQFDIEGARKVIPAKVQPR